AARAPRAGWPPPPRPAPPRAPGGPRGRECYAVLNLYPYNSGHLMVLPYRHVSDYVDLTPTETAELATMTQTAVRALRAAFAPAGFNLGMNQGEVAGAGIAAHLHQHVVPRWLGDANFLPVVGQTKALPELLAETRARVAAAWDGVDGGDA
ncbi:HIT family protein, partial [Isoptericola cucumis]|uniref:HIT family protein n=1 Tax=Isoptericola cucumis TaxID=1776856 RepID=UPI003D162CDE